MSRDSPESLTVTSLRNVGPAVAARLELLGITTVGQLAGTDPLALFERIEDVRNEREDPCLLDTLLSAVDQADGWPPRPWWEYGSRRRELMTGRRSRGSARRC